MTRHLARRAALLVAVTVVAGACASGPRETAAVTPEAIPALEAQRAQAPIDPSINLKLARAYYAASRFADARAALAVVLTSQPQNSEARAYLGLIYEGLNQFDSARTTYNSLLANKPSRGVQKLLQGRLALLAQAELHYTARQALARESLLVKTPPPGNTVAVLPFRYVGQDTLLKPLERGLAALVVTDLSQVKTLRLVEREQMQVLLDEMHLGASSRTDPSTGARSGYLVGAAEVVQGQFQDQNRAIRLDASVVRATDAGIAATGSGSDQLAQLFDIEKQVVLQLLDKMGVTLTPAERVAISERPTKDIQAFLLYSRGLQAEEQGNYAAAAEAFSAAAQRDPGFSAAQQGAAQSGAAQSANTAPPTDIAPPPAPSGGEIGAGPGGQLGDGINNTVPGGGSVLDQVGPANPPPDPNRICEGRCDGTLSGLVGTLIIIIHKP
ncbi:MAG TPA: tetratricopeptide repeat protein [Gemmatimonadales bacterium]|nr:tetratricopeptide repeat protein [Gemmatimonadales bacterium]